MIVDSHMHTGDLPYPFDVRSDIAKLGKCFADQELDAGLVFCQDNGLTRQVLAAIPNAGALYWAHPRERGWLQDAERFVDSDDRVRGVKLHPLIESFYPSDPMLDPLMEMLGERGLVAFFHTGHAIFSEPTQLMALAGRHPDTPIVLGHMGGQNIFYVRGAIDMALRFPSVWLETSAMPMHDLVRQAQLATGRVLYGSDVPCHPWLAQRAVVTESGLDPENLARVLGGNAAELFFPKGLPR
jgi:uncharacterized protein